MANKLSKAPKMNQMNHAAGIYADISVDGPSIGTLVAVVDRAKNLPNRKTMGKQNPYCAARLGKEARKTQTDWRGGQTPKWDQELRFNVHESADYFKLKVSVFNDDKRTDLIGETWVGLKDLIKPGGSQGDHWHPLQCRGKYAGEVRIEMTYYDTRPEDEAVIERRKGVVEKTQEKPSMGSSSLSGPRQPKDIKRRPLPTDPVGSERPPRPAKIPSAPGPHFQAPTNPIPRYPGPHDMPDMPPAKGYETPDDFHRFDSQPHPGSVNYHDYYDERRAYDMPMNYRRDPRPDPVDDPRMYETRPQVADPRYQMMPYQRAPHSTGPVERERPRSHGNAFRNRDYPGYAAMQPRVEDEDEEGPPPPPPVHRSGVAYPGPSYQAYTADQRPMSSHSSHSQRRFQEPQGGPVPASLVAGYDPVIAEDEAERVGYENQAMRRNSAFEEPVLFPEPLNYAPPYPVEQNVDEQRKTLGSRGSAHSDSRAVQRKSVSPQPEPEQESSIPFSPDSYDALNPNAARSAVNRDPKPSYGTPAEAMDAARRTDAEAGRDPGPIIGEDGQEIDPSDHLPTDTWAPEPERKNRKPEVIIRFKNSKANPGRERGYKTQSESTPRRQPEYNRTPRSRESYSRYSTPTDSPYRSSVSPSRSPSSLYAPNTGPPIPAKVPIAQPANQSYPMTSQNPGMDALSRELKSIDIGSVACNPGRGRRYAPSSVTGYAV